MTFDDLRIAHPGLGFAVYAYEPDKGVTLSVMEGGEAFEFHGATFADAINAAFPPQGQTPKADVPAAPAPAPTAFD